MFFYGFEVSDVRTREGHADEHGAMFSTFQLNCDQHVPNGEVQDWDTWNGSCACLPLFCSPHSVWKTGTRTSIGSQPSVSSTARACLVCDETWCSEWHRRQTLRHRHGYHSWMPKTDGWGPTGLMLGDALTKDKADAADLLRACVGASASLLADESSTLPRAREEREAPIVCESRW